MQQKKATQSTKERKTRLEKRNKAAKKITAKARGKQNEYLRAYRQQKKAAESTNEIETRLSKQKGLQKQKVSKTSI